MTSPHEYAQNNAERFRAQLFDFLRIPSVSTDPAYKDDVRRAAEWLAEDMTQIGLNAEVIPTEKHPLVYAEWLDAGDDAPTVLIYGHYDVQPAKLADGWDHEPFEPVETDGKVYARGATDDKGQMYVHVKAVESVLKAEGKLPVNVKFLIEGEEESGGASIAKYVKENPDRLRADVCLISDTSMKTIDQPVIVSSLRGAVALELHVTGPQGDLHSGMYGGTIHNPAQAIAEIVAKLHDDDGIVTVPGFYNDVRALSDIEREAIASVPWTEDDWRAETGAAQPWGEREYSLRERIGARPTLEINGIAGGYFEAGFKTVIPRRAWAKISCRLVPDQDPDRIVQAIKDYVAQITPPTISSEVIQLGPGKGAAMVDVTHPAMEAAVAAYEKGWGAKPVFLREGGSIPIVSDFQAVLGVPVILMGFGLNTDNLHAPNEHFTLAMFHKGIDTAIHFLYETASRPV